MKVWQLIVVGIAVHVVFFYSIFDIYFTSPLVHGMTPITSGVIAPSKRLVLFVADGLRADKFFELDGNKKNIAPFLRNIIESQGSWGISHTRVPTESRPGHVALIAGFYEDVSAVAKGWKENPVEFDSVFNESRQTWSWGSPDILPMFAKGASGDHVSIHCYSSNLEDFAGADMTRLDTWVFEEVEKLFSSSSKNSTLREALHKDKLVFFLHLLGIDTHGHSHKPYSEAYSKNIKLVDEGIERMVALIDHFYNDSWTSYVMTSDHGMTNWGSHGAGLPEETLTPIVAWGAGIRGPILTSNCGAVTDTFCDEWGLQKVKRTDVQQADIAPLMSYLIGVPYPVNSVGTLPVDFLDSSDHSKAVALLANAEQILIQFEVKMKQVKKRTISATFRPFQELTDSEKLRAIKHIRQLIDNGHFEDAFDESRRLIDLALEGLKYYQTYDRFFLGASIVAGFLGWMSYTLYLLLLNHTSVGQFIPPSPPPQKAAAIMFLSLGITVAALLYVQSLPVMCYIYCLLPVILWYKCFESVRLIQLAIGAAVEKKTLSTIGVWLLLCAAGLEIVILSFYYRELLSLGLLALSCWPLASLWWHGGLPASKLASAGWSLSCLLVAIFPLLPVVSQNKQYHFVHLSGLLAVVIGTLIIIKFLKNGKSSCYLWILQVVLVLLSMITVKLTSDSIDSGQGLSIACQLSSWSILGFCIVVPMCSSTSLHSRLFSLALSFFAPYLLLSIQYEGLFFLSLISLLYFWLKMEFEASERSMRQKFELVDFKEGGLVKDNITSPVFSRYLELGDLRRAFFFIFLLLVAFFGTGNIASINSFDPASVYCFLTVFSPFLMGSLMMLKVSIPFLVVTCAFRAVHVLTSTPMRSLFLIVLIMSDYMALHFFFLVKDYGSWLDIGTTISHYVIVMVLNIFMFILTGISHGLTCWTLTWPIKSDKLS